MNLVFLSKDDLINQPVGTILIFESAFWPVLTKRPDGLWSFVLPGVSARPTINSATAIFWVNASNNKCWLY